MRNLVGHAFILGLVSSLTAAEYSGSRNGGGGGSSSNDGYGKSGLDSSYNGGYIGEYAGQLGAGKALGELHSYGESQIAPEHGSQYDEGESDFGDAYRQQGDSGNKYSSNQYDGYSHNLELSKFPVDVDAHHYTGEDQSDTVLDEENHGEEQQQYVGHNEYQGDDNDDDDDGNGGQNAKQHSLAYNPYEQSQKSSDYNEYNDGNRMLIVPYSGYEEAEQNGEQPSHYSSYENSQHSYNQAYEEPKAQSYESSGGSSYSSSHESPKAPSPTYSSYYKSVKAPSPAPTHDYSSSKPAGYGSQANSYQHSSSLVTDAPSKTLNIVQNIKSPGLKNFHTSLQKNIMTIDHGHGSFSYSSLYRS